MANDMHPVATAADPHGLSRLAEPGWPPDHRLPPGSCDTHIHVIGPPTRYPLFAGRSYTPGVHSLDDYRHTLQALGVDRAVLVQPSVYGTDNRALLDALHEGGTSYRGVVVPAPDIAEEGLLEMHAAGVRGLRLNLVNPAVLTMAQALDLCARTRGLGWHLQVQLRLDAAGIADMRRLAAKATVPLVIDHAGLPSSTQDLSALLGLLEETDAWIKLSAPYRFSREAFPHADITPIVQALVETRPQRLLWASDWPHTEQPEPRPSAISLVALLHGWVPDAAIRHRICIANPAALYGYPQTT